jgi:hypothetical protein
MLMLEGCSANKIKLIAQVIKPKTKRYNETRNLHNAGSSLFHCFYHLRSLIDIHSILR